MRPIRPLLGLSVGIGVASVLTACAGATKPDVPEAETQRKARSDLESCNVAAGSKAYGFVVTPEGRYSFQVQGHRNAETILTCMASKGYSTRLVQLEPYGFIDASNPDRFRVGGQGEPSR